MLEITGGSKGAVGDAQRWRSPASTVVARWNSSREIGELGDTWRWEESWYTVDPEPDSLGTSQRFGLLRMVD